MKTTHLICHNLKEREPLGSIVRNQSIKQTETASIQSIIRPICLSASRVDDQPFLLFENTRTHTNRALNTFDGQHRVTTLNQIKPRR